MRLRTSGGSKQKKHCSLHNRDSVLTTPWIGLAVVLARPQLFQEALVTIALLPRLFGLA